MAVKVNEQLCNLCGTCVEKCPWKAIKINKRLVINESECSECGTCVESCPNVAIHF